MSDTSHLKAERDDDERSDRSTGSSVRFLVATPVKDIPSEWQRSLPLTSTPILHSRTMPSQLVCPDITQSTGAIAAAAESAAQAPHGLSSSTHTSATRPAKRTCRAIAAPEGALNSSTMMLLRSPTSKDGIKLFKQINGSGKAVLYPFHQADDGSKKAILTLLTTDSAPRQPSAAQAADTPAETHRTAADVLQAIQISQPAAIVPQKRKLSIIPHKLPYAAVAAIKPIPQPDYTKPTILRLTNVPWTITVDELIEWLGIEIHMLPYSVQIISVHILCDRSVFHLLNESVLISYVKQAERPHKGTMLRRDRRRKSRTRHRRQERYDVAQRSPDQDYDRNDEGAVNGGKFSFFMNRRSLTKEARQMFPAWAQASPALMYKPATVILTAEEIEGLKKLCNLQVRLSFL